MATTVEARRDAIAKALGAATDPESRAGKVDLPYKDGKEGPFTVVSVPVAAVVFNPRSHRIKSQLESHDKRDIVKDDPYSDEAQNVVYELLAATEGFEQLKENLKEYGQKDHGVVTRGGLLVNANTRLAALRELGIDYIRAAVLPDDADEAAIDRLELELQVQRDFKQDYTFTNELIFINELLESPGYDEEKVAKALNYAASADPDELKRGTKRVKQCIRLLALIRETQELSDGAVPPTFFDDKRQSLIDLDDEYQTLSAQDPDAAEEMKYARLAGVLVGSKYRDLRKINSESIEDVLQPFLEEKSVLSEVMSSSGTSTPGDSGGEAALNAVDDDSSLLAGGDEGGSDSDEESGMSLHAVARLLATSYGKDEIELPSGATVAREDLTNEVAEAIEETSEDVTAVQRSAKNLNSPVSQLEEAVRKTKVAMAGFVQFHSDPAFQHGKFKFNLKKLKKQLTALDKAIEQSEK
jgi:hypothetical protein